MQETGWNFDTKQEAEKFLASHNFIKIAEDEYVNESENTGPVWMLKVLVLEED